MGREIWPRYDVFTMYDITLNNQILIFYHLSTQLTFTLDYTVDRPTAETALERLEEKVKLGDLRVTLIQQLYPDSAEVTINAGTQN